MVIEYTDIPDVANVEIIEGSPSGSPMSQGPVYQELHCMQMDKEYHVAGSSPDHGYESDGRGPSYLRGSDFQEEIDTCTYYGQIPFAEVFNLPTTAGPYEPMLSSATDASTNLVTSTAATNASLTKVEPADDLWLAENQIFADHLAEERDFLDFTGLDCGVETNEMFFPPISVAQTSITADPTNPTQWGAQQMYHQLPKLEPEPEQYMAQACMNTEDFSCGRSPLQINELEISDSEEIECQISFSPLPETSTKMALRRGRKSSKQPILWKFLLNALNDRETYGDMIRWVNIDEGTFQFTSSRKEELSKKWGEAKRNRCTMTYQKMARAMRNYINKEKVLNKVKKKLQYEFRKEFYCSIQDMIVR